jgi:Lariat debranching enzyme, C-terminal domain
VNENVKDLKIPENFEVTAPIHDAKDPPSSLKQRIARFDSPNLAPFYENTQTKRFCELLDIDFKMLPR